MSGDPLTAAPAAPAAAVLALGTNLGDRGEALRSAVRALRSVPGVRVRAVSPVVETDPVGGPEQPDYLNAVVLVETDLAPQGLLDACQDVEARHRRDRSPAAVRWGARTLDVDVVDYAGLVAASERLVLPHPRAHTRAFVLAPWHAVDPAAVLPGPGGGRVADLLAAAGAQGVRPAEVAL
ncbi:2-amino-4-hydroxy-6-hydroxymethyldihydropteridine diphosphokinase [Kineococcus xinjiangensis]|uniref:2-amino-4-hydroxy-6-hydroxymethyldihydropteridine diphosphokinase n=1 Tax=Kineococcus xinjiangensis TaxID=512762 RepID=A0A2S6IGT7_9ACTN|nr:2-amino-4-hydroxy-6-hydroxymethyldihydropteridine diphosphokinase [Kineococcus xinjiangensis]PPK93434.1 2-amino-4-hydroxy-6-hydroxymethyldihydropteridine diphosphokinase [Kineococcus xinjiangensis]